LSFNGFAESTAQQANQPKNNLIFFILRISTYLSNPASCDDKKFHFS